HGWAWRRRGCERTWRAGLVSGRRIREIQPQDADTAAWGGGAGSGARSDVGAGVLRGDLDAREQAVRVQQDREALADLGDRVDVVGVGRGNVLELLGRD